MRRGRPPARERAGRERRAAGPRRGGLRAKRALDVAGSATALVVLSPLLALVALAVRIADGPPVLFRQERPGLGGRPFTLVKFRTMRPPRAGEVWWDTDGQRVTRLGRLLRATSLDELPELWNVLRGDMSLVGPRPLLLEYLDHYTAEERRRHDVRPGVTGWAVVTGRNALGFRERLALDVWYVDHRSLWLDVTILARTAWKVVSRSDAAVVEDNAAIGFPLPAVRVGGARGGEPSPERRRRTPIDPREEGRT